VLLKETPQALKTQSAVWIDSVTHTQRHLHEHVGGGGIKRSHTGVNPLITMSTHRGYDEVIG